MKIDWKYVSRVSLVILVVPFLVFGFLATLAFEAALTGKSLFEDLVHWVNER